MTSTTLSEHESKQLLARYGVPFPEERPARSAEEAAGHATSLGFPVALKLNGEGIAHKTERGMVRLGLSDPAAVERAARELLDLVPPNPAEPPLLVAPMVRGRRELIAGLVRDPQFGPVVLLGSGGIQAEALGDVAFAVPPLEDRDVERMAASLRAAPLILQSFRGEPPVSIAALTRVLNGLGRLADERPDVRSVDLNPLIVADGEPVAVDALVELGEVAAITTPPPPLADDDVLERFRPLFDPRGVVVAGVSSHPGRVGSQALHNILRFGYEGRVFPVSRSGATLYGLEALTDVSQVPPGEADLIVVCTPAEANEEVVRSAAARGVRAAFVAAGGYREVGEEGARLERELTRAAEECGIVLAGPNGQGVISTPASLCAQFLAPYPPAGPISVVSQSGNLMSSFLNYSRATGVGVRRAISVGNAAATSVSDYLEYLAADEGTRVVIAYLEGIDDGPRFRRAVERLTARKPLVVLKGGVADAGRRAAASHTGSLASDDRVFDGIARQLGVLRASGVAEAFEWAATLATQPLPAGRRTIVFTTVGGWGVLTADACAGAGLDLIELPPDLVERIDELVPARWSRANPIDLAGGETRDTIPQVLELLAAHPDVDAVIHIGIGIQSNQADAFRSGPYDRSEGVERLVDFHERQDARYARAARDVSEAHGKPVLSVTELAHASGERTNPGVAALRDAGRLAYAGGEHAARALGALTGWAEFHGRRG